MSDSFGDYTLLRRIGAGGMGDVFLAHQGNLDRLVALKLLREAVDDEKHRLRFYREARVASRLSHPGLAKLYDFGELGGIPFLSMEYIEGETLTAILGAKGTLDPAEVRRIILELLDTLAACHAESLIHRDIKPGNVMLETTGGRVRLLDLGLAKPLGRTFVTRAGDVVGTPRYLAPEQFLQLEVDERSDIYQVGLLTYECLAGHPAFRNPSLPALVEDIVNRPPAPLDRTLTDGAPWILPFLERTLCKSAADRFPSCAAASSQLRERTRPTRPRAVPLVFPQAGPAVDPAAPPERTAPPRAQPDRPVAGALRQAPQERRPSSGRSSLARLFLTAAAGAAVMALALAIGVRRQQPRSHAATVPVITHGREGWGLRFAAGPGIGLVVTASHPDGPWQRHEEWAAAGSDHFVEFREWPPPGGRLFYRLGTTGALDPTVRPLEIAGDSSPIELDCETHLSRLFVSFKTRGTVSAALSVEGAAPVSDPVPTQHHRFALAGLPGGRKLTLRVLAGGRPVASQEVRLPTGAELTHRVLEALTPVTREQLRMRFHREAGPVVSSPARLAALRTQWQSILARQFPAATTASTMRGYAPSRRELAEDRTIPPTLTARWVHDVNQFLDLRAALASAFTTDLGLSALAVDGPGISPEPGIPAGFAPLLALRFGDGGRAAGRTPLELPGLVRVPPPARFHDFEREMLFGVTVDQARQCRSTFRQPGPLVARVPARAYLRYRLAGGEPVQRLVVTVGSSPVHDNNAEVASLRPRSGRVSEGAIRIDERLLADPKASLFLFYKDLIVRPTADGPVLDHLVIYGQGP